MKCLLHSGKKRSFNFLLIEARMVDPNSATETKFPLLLSLRIRPHKNGDTDLLPYYVLKDSKSLHVEIPKDSNVPILNSGSSCRHSKRVALSAIMSTPIYSPRAPHKYGIVKCLTG